MFDGRRADRLVLEAVAVAVRVAGAVRGDVKVRAVSYTNDQAGFS